MKMSQKTSDTIVGLDDLVEDLFGMNIRSFKTIWVLFSSPRQYFVAAKTPAWMNLYTPSTRLWLGLMAILIALQFFWAKPDAAFMSNLAATLQTGLADAATKAGSSADFAAFDMKGELQKAMKLNYLIYPFVFVFIFSIFAWIYRAWGEVLSFTVRLRYVFAVIVPASVIGLVTTLVTPFLTATQLPLFSVVQTIVILGLYFLTGFRGAFGHMDKGEAFGRSIVLAIGIFITLTIAQIISYGLSFGISLLPAAGDFIQNGLP
jgi:hypothetical protein